MITRPIMRYHGGKFRLAPWIISHFPNHQVYVEPFGGGASVLLRKNRSYAEVYNDLDGEVVNLFRVARDNGNELARLCQITPFSRAEFELSYESSMDPLEQARRTLIRSFMGFGSASAAGVKTGFRANSNRSGSTPAHDWVNYPNALRAVIERLQGVIIENRDAYDVIAHHDTPEALIYLDPPYIQSTRSQSSKEKGYKFEMTDDQHLDLLTKIKNVSGMVVISGYENDLYNDMLACWQKVSKKAFADGAKERTEVLWLSPNIKQHSLFQEVA